MIEQLTEEEERLLAKDDRATAAVGPKLLIGACLILASIAILGWQLLAWLKSAAWPFLPFGELLSMTGQKPLKVSWAGMQQIIDWIAAAPASGVLFGCGLFVLWSATWGDDAPVPDALRQARMKRARIRTSELRP